MAETPTIFALSTAPGRAGVGIFRISGPLSFKSAVSLCGKINFGDRRAHLRRLKHPKTGQIMDEALVLTFNCPHSFTGEDMAEFHVHGSAAVYAGMSEAFLALGLRQAEPGEFTRRAFQNGKMDLTEAEGLADLIDSETVLQREQALRQMQGGLKSRYENWASDILDALAFIEGEIDFPDEEDVPEELSLNARASLSKVCGDMEKALGQGDIGQQIRDGLDVAIIGRPNAGKSSLINTLANRDVAIVSHTPGTTRDIVEAQTVLAGLPVRFADTAGLRDTDEDIEREGVRRAKARAEDADIRILVIDGADDTQMPAELDDMLQDGDLVLWNKKDLANVSRETSDRIWISASTGEGLDHVKSALIDIINARYSLREEPGLTRERHKNCVARAAEHLRRAEGHIGIQPELAGEEARAALHAIAELSGAFDVEAVLDRVFSSFCIGK